MEMSSETRRELDKNCTQNLDGETTLIRTVTHAAGKETAKLANFAISFLL